MDPAVELRFSDLESTLTRTREELIQLQEKTQADSGILSSTILTESSRVSTWVQGSLKVLEEKLKELENKIDHGNPVKSGHVDRQENILSRREARDIKRFGGTGGPNYHDWKFELSTLLEQCGPDVNEVISWVDQRSNIEDITEQAFDAWIEWDGQDKDRMEWAVNQLFYILAAKTEDVAKDQVQSLQAEGRIRGAKAWKRVQTTAAGLTDNRLQYLMREVTNPTRAKNYDELTGAIAIWEKSMRELDKFPNAGLSEQQKISCLRRLVPESLEENLLAQANAMKTYAMVMEYVESQVALRRSAIPNPTSTRTAPSTRPSPPKNSAMEMNLGTDFPHDDWGPCETAWGDTGEDENNLFNVAQGGGKGKGGWPIRGNCRHCGEYGHMLRHCPKLDAEMMAARKGKGKGKGKGPGHGGKGMFYGKGLGGKPDGSKGGWNSKGKGWIQPGQYQNPWGAGGYGGKSGLNEVGDTPSTMDDAWQIRGIHALTTSTPLRQRDCPAREASIPTQNRFHALHDDDDEPECDDHPSASTICSEDQFHDTFPTAAEAEPSSQRKKRMPRCGRWKKFLMPQGPIDDEDLLKNAALRYKEAENSEQNRQGNIGEEQGYRGTSKTLPSPPSSSAEQFHGLGFLGPLAPSSGGLNQVHRATGEQWEEVASIVDSGAVDSVAPTSIVKGVSIRESMGSANGLTYHTADGTRLPNLGEKSFVAFTDDGVSVKQTFQMAEVTRPLSSVGCITDNDNLVVFGRKGGYIWDLKTNTTTSFKREQGVYVLRTWVKTKCQGADDRREPPFIRQG